MMAKYILLLVMISCVYATHAQKDEDSLDITLSSFVKRESQGEILYISVLIKSKFSTRITIDDTQGMAICPNAIGVKLICQHVRDSCFSEHSSSDCHPLVDQEIVALKKVLEPYGSYSYVIRFANISWPMQNEQRAHIIRSSGVFRFKLELPFWINDKSYLAKSKRWHYYAL